MKQNNKNKTQIQISNKPDQIVLICIVLVVGLIPLLVHSKMQTYIMPVLDPLLNLTTGVYVDYFTYYKAMALMLVAIFLVLRFLAKIFISGQKLRATELNIPLLVFGLALCLSALFSDYKTLAIWGGYTRNLGTIAYLSYLVLLFVLLNSQVEEKWDKIIGLALCPLVFINALMILISYYGVNLWNNSIFTQLLAGAAAEYLTESSRIYGTLNHLNYMSGFGAIMFAFFTGKSILDTAESLWERILYIFMSICSALIVFSSRAESGAVTIALCIPILLGIAIEKRKGGFNLLLILIFTALSWTVLSFKDYSFIKELIQDIGLLIVSAGFGIIFFVVYLMVRNWSKFNKRLISMIIGIALLICIVLAVVTFPIISDKVKAEFERTNTDLVMQRLEKNPFDFPEAKFGWGTGRVYIWQNTLELVAKRPLFGYGLDTLTFEFNQGDPAKIGGLGDSDTIVDKPHNAYVNLLYGAGSISLLAFLAIIVLVVWRALKALSTDSKTCYLIWPALLGMLAYLYQGLFNDPVHGIEQIFWVLMGLTYVYADKAINGKVQKSV